MKSRDMGWNSMVILLGVSLFIMDFSSAINIGVSPANINFQNVLRGGYAERPIRVTLDSEKPTKISTSKRGEIADWINLSSKNFTLSRGNPPELIVSVSPPEDTPNGIYGGFIRIQGEKTGEPIKDHATGIIIPVLDLHVTVQITDQEIRDCKSSNFKILSAEKGDEVIFTADILNNGNIRFSPLISLDIWNQDSSAIVKEVRDSGKEITPTKKEEVMVKISTENLEIGQYWVDAITVDCYNEQILTFDVLEEGALRASGILKEIRVPVWVDEGDTVPILASFTNNGEKALETKFKGKVTLQNKIVQLIESDENVFVQVGKDADFQFYFTPKQAGRYLISGRVFYDGKRTYEKSAALNVRSKNKIFSLSIKILTYLILLAIIALLLSKIRKERKLYGRVTGRSR